MSDNPLISISPAGHQALLELARETNSSIEDVLEQAIETQRRKLVLERTNEAFAALRRDEPAWREYSAELEAWDVTLHDGL